MEGEGTAAYTNGDVYEGNFANGKRQGEGTMTYADGLVAQGTWDNNQLQDAVTSAVDTLPDPSPQPDTDAEGTVSQ